MAPGKDGVKNEGVLASLTAGAIAGAVEGAVTYPFEFLKTQSQFASNHAPGSKPPGLVQIARTTYQRKGIRAFYSGCSALVCGNALKAGVRFLSYDRFKELLRKEDGSLTAVRALLAGTGAGVMESIFAVTPSETIKTKLIDDAKSPNPRFHGLVHGTRTIFAEQGIRGIYSGLFPVTLRQAANSTVRFGSYNALKTFVQGSTRPGEQLPSTVTFAIGGMAGLITVLVTQPIDTVKTRMQSLNARQEYRNTFHAFARIGSEEGVLRFWRGTAPRLGRLVLSGGIVFTVYERVIVLLGGRSV